jgi:hypothetical protein
MASAYDGCSYHQVKTPIGFWCRRDLNPGPLLNDKRLYQLNSRSESLLHFVQNREKITRELKVKDVIKSTNVYSDNRLDKPRLRNIKVHGEGFGQCHVSKK